jgi:hypothetical protein
MLKSNKKTKYLSNMRFCIYANLYICKNVYIFVVKIA